MRLLCFLRFLIVAGLVLVALLITRDARAQGLTLSLSVLHGKNPITAVMTTMADPATARIGRNYAALWSPCIGGVETTVPTRASHPGGNRYGWLNESIGGRINNCHLSPKGQRYSLYVAAGALRNSQFQDTVVAGPGIKFRLANAWNISVDVGVEALVVSYGRWGGRAPVRGILPDFYVGLNYQLTKQIQIGWRQVWLPLGVTMRAASTNAPFNNGGVEERVSASMSAAHQSTMTPPPGLSLVLTYQF